MDIRKSLEILELDHEPGLDEAKQAYKDLVNVWHPDRFNENPRLRERAEKKLKEVNLAYETVETHLISKETRNEAQMEGHENASGPESNSRRNQHEDRAGRTTETAFEAGTFFVLNAWARLSETVRRFVGEATTAAGDTRPAQGPVGRGRGQGQGRGKGGGGGRGQGMRGGPGMGRGKGRGRGRQR